MAAALSSDAGATSRVRDDEHNAWPLRVDDRSLGYPRTDTITARLIASAEYRTLDASYAEIGPLARGLRRGGVEVRLAVGKADEPEEEEPADADEAVQTPETVAEFAEFAAAAAVAARRRPGRPRTRRCRSPSLDEFVEHFIALGRKGVAVNRYKGLGEMNPDTLWATTMNPDDAHAAAGEGRGSHRSRPDVHHADGRPGGAAAQVHRGQRARRPEPGYLSSDGG